MNLKQILKEVLAETEKLIDFPSEDFTISLFADERKLVFMPKYDSQKAMAKIRIYVNAIKQNFRVGKINSLDDEQSYTQSHPKFQNAFEVYLDPAQDWNQVIQYLKDNVK